MKLPIGSRERDDLRIQIELEILKQVDKWERQRASLSSDLNGNQFHNTAEKLARLVRKWRRL